MNDHIELDGKRYRTIHGQWTPLVERPMVIKRLLSGKTNVTWGPTTFPGWRGLVSVPIPADAQYGNIDDFRLTYNKRSVLPYTDHYGIGHQVVIERTVDERSLSPQWDAPDNVIQVNITLIKVSE